MSLDDLRHSVAEFAQERDWEQFHIPRSLLLALIAEVGELAELVQWAPDEALDERWIEDHKSRLSEEMADILVYLVRLADVLNVDLLEAASSKIRQNSEKYPVEKSRGNSRKYNEL